MIYRIELYIQGFLTMLINIFTLLKLPNTDCDKILFAGSIILFLQHFVFFVVNLLIFCKAYENNWRLPFIYDCILPIMRGITLPFLVAFKIILFYYIAPNVDNSKFGNDNPNYCDKSEIETTKHWIMLNILGLVILYTIFIARLSFYLNQKK